MNKTIIEKEIIKTLIKNTYQCFREKERDGKTKSATIADIVKMIKKELKNNAN